MKYILSTLAALVAFTLASPAASILSDDFNYPDGAIVGAAGSPWVYTSGTAGSMIVTNGELEISTSRTEDIAAPLSGGPFASNGPVAAVYAKFTVRFSLVPTAAGTYFAHFTGENITTDFRARLLASTTNVTTGVLAGAGKFYLGIANNSGNVTASVPFPTELSLDTTYTVVTKFDLRAGQSTLWIDPTDEASTSVTATTGAALTNPKYFGFRQSTGEGILRVDGLRVGTQFSDVAGNNTAPTISSIASQSIPRNGTTGPLPFVVNDAEKPASQLTVSPASTNLTLVPLSGISINNGDGTNRTVTVTPATGQQGNSLITLTVSDGANTASSSFLVAVGAPVISPIPNQIAYSNTPVPMISFTVTDAENDALTVTASSGNATLLPDANVVLGGSGANRTLTLTPVAGLVGSASITVTANDGFNNATRRFYLTVCPRLGDLFSDKFQYTDFLLPNALYGATGSPWQTVSGTGYEVQCTNGWAYLSAALTEDVGATLTNSLGIWPNLTNYTASEAVVFYSSFTLRVNDISTANGDYFAHLKNTYNGTTFRAKVFVSTNGAAPGSYRIGVANQANSGTYMPVDCTVGTDYLVVTRYNSAIGEASLWVNPTSESSTYVVGTDLLQTTAIGGYGLRQSSNPGMGSLQISNLVVSTSFPSLPTPSAITLTGIRVSGGQVTITFSAGESDSASGFDLLTAAAANGAYATTGAVVANLGGGKFQAQTSTGGNTQFYRVKRK